jgi:hypothetical protein
MKLLSVALFGVLAVVSGCASAADGSEPDEQVGVSTDELRIYHGPGGPVLSSSLDIPGCTSACSNARSACRDANDAADPDDPKEPCELNYELCYGECIRPR